MPVHIIPVAPATLDIIEVLNGGVRPEVEDEETFFIYNGENRIPLIVHRDFIAKYAEGWWTKAIIMYNSAGL